MLLHVYAPNIVVAAVAVLWEQVPCEALEIKN